MWVEVMSVISRGPPNLLHNPPWSLISLICQLVADSSWRYQGSRGVTSKFFFFLKRPDSKLFACHTHYFFLIAVKNAKNTLCPHALQKQVWGPNCSMGRSFPTFAQDGGWTSWQKSEFLNDSMEQYPAYPFLQPTVD